MFGIEISSEGFFGWEGTCITTLIQHANKGLVREDGPIGEQGLRKDVAEQMSDDTLEKSKWIQLLKGTNKTCLKSLGTHGLHMSITAQLHPSGSIPESWRSAAPQRQHSRELELSCTKPVPLNYSKSGRVALSCTEIVPLSHSIPKFSLFVLLAFVVG
ncbi:hypothetical protein LR48_Vigan07g062700 [Vigna angularis]|uniref:Uncharacterized protein n=1 Tax=Phaseolus angularis TaxID=3914 RepID=A0A0L9UVZ1_PHAAN|nr:hypothetical protein LR48_Vigan07g062700 [Vigna angularis]